MSTHITVEGRAYLEALYVLLGINHEVSSRLQIMIKRHGELDFDSSVSDEEKLEIYEQMEIEDAIKNQ